MLVLAFAIISCNKKETKENVAGSIKITFNTANLLYEDVFKKTLIIPLETNSNCLISKISQMKIYKNKIFILDINLNALLVFNMEGRFLNRIGSVGKGPGEYIRPRYFFISEKDGLVKVFDAPMKKLICFDIEGKYNKDITVDKYLSNVGETNSGYWGYCADRINDGINSKQQRTLKFFIFDSEGQLKGHISGRENIDNINLSNAYILNDMGESVSFVEPFSPDIYYLKNGEISVKYKIDYSGFSPPQSVLSKVGNMKAPISKMGMEFLNTITYEYASFFINFLENENWILLSTPFKTRTIIYNKIEKKSTEFSNIFWSNKERKPYFYPCCIEDDNLICYAGYDDIKRELSINNQISIGRKKKLESLVAEMKNNDNPVVLICTMND
jgi:hypothetical protein